VKSTVSSRRRSQMAGVKNRTRLWRTMAVVKKKKKEDKGPESYCWSLYECFVNFVCMVMIFEKEEVCFIFWGKLFHRMASPYFCFRSSRNFVVTSTQSKKSTSFMITFRWKQNSFST
jgi:hypothetical protein